MGSALALEGAAREAVSAGSGFELVEQSRVPGELRAGYAGTIDQAGRTGKVFTVQGFFNIPLSPLGFDLDADISSGVLVPDWEFVP
jgi:hypothetical protein